ncbi:MAG: hypothetical protein ACOYJB_03920 [Christensenellaceae bacterium]|jgi:hypothetical protein
MKKRILSFIIGIALITLCFCSCSEPQTNEIAVADVKEQAQTAEPIIEPTSSPSAIPTEQLETEPPDTSDNIDEFVIDEGAIYWNDAYEHVGEKVKLYGPVIGATYASSSNGKPTFLNIGKDYPDTDRVSVVIWGDNRSNFDTAPEIMYSNQQLYVEGTIKLYRGTAQIEVATPSQITIIETSAAVSEPSNTNTQPHPDALSQYEMDQALREVYEWAAPNLCTKYRVSGGGIVKVSYTAYTML